MVECPICSKPVKESAINQHLDSGCQSNVIDSTATAKPPSGFFSKTPKRNSDSTVPPPRRTPTNGSGISNVNPVQQIRTPTNDKPSIIHDTKRKLEDQDQSPSNLTVDASSKKSKLDPHAAVPLAERMRPCSLDEVCGQELVSQNGVIRGLIEQERVPSMILWGGSGTGKTTIARLIAKAANCRFIEINSTSSGVGECKKLFAEARNELGLTGRKTIIFCDEIHRFNKAQQDVFLGPVEAGQVILIGATTENPSFKVVNALLSRCRTFTLSKLTDDNIVEILNRAMDKVCSSRPELLDDSMLRYLAQFSDGDARTALNLLELALSLVQKPGITTDAIKKSLTQTLVYDRAGDQHYNTISAFHKSVRGSDPDAALYYLARMVQSGEDPLYIARRMIVIASEDVGLADNTMLPLAIAAYTAVEKVGLPEAQINLAHAAVALSLAPKSTRVYRGLGAAMAALAAPGVAGLPVPIHLRNAPTRMMKELGYGKEYKYNPDYVDGHVSQTYLPDKLVGTRYLEDRDFGTKVDVELGGNS